jgi:hypothetical protein
LSALGTLPWVRLVSPAASAAPDDPGLPVPHMVEEGSAEALLSCLADLSSDTLVLVDRDTTVDPIAAHIATEPLLLEAELCVGFVGINAITGLCVGRSLRYCSRERVLRDAAPPEPDIVVPKIAGTWWPNRTPEAAFRSAFDTICRQSADWPRDSAGKASLGLSASLGSDVENGYWWLLGGGLALLGRNGVDAAWRAERALLFDTGELASRTQEVARLVRVRRGVPVWPMAPMQSRLVKETASTWPPARFWSEFSEACGRLGPKGEALAAAHDRAARLIWALPPAEPAAVASTGPAAAAQCHPE